MPDAAVATIDEELDLGLEDLSMYQAEELLEKMGSEPMRPKGRPPGPRQFDRKYQVQELWGKHLEIIRMSVLGLSHIAIAKQLNITPVTVSYVLNSKLGSARVKELQGRADDDTVAMNKRFRETASEAQTILAKAMNDGDTDMRLRVNIAMDKLDRAGHSAIKKIDAKVALGIFTKDDIDEMSRDAASISKMKDNAIKVARENGNLADIVEGDVSTDGAAIKES